MRPVSAEHETSQGFGSMKTAGVVPDYRPASGVAYYVYLYGDYQPFGHAGEDIGCDIGTPVYAMAAGTVLWADWGTNLPGDDSEWGYRQRWYLYKGFPGKVLVVQHDGWIGVYAHLSEFAVTRGATVREGQLVAKSGNTGGVAPHLHIEALVDLNYTTGGDKIYGRVDPSRYYGSISPQGTITTTSQEDDMSADMPMKSKDGKNVTLEILLNSIDTKVDGLPKMDAQFREQFSILSNFNRDVRAALEQSKAREETGNATIAALSATVAALSEGKDLSSEDILARVEAVVAKYAQTWTLSVQAGKAEEPAA